MKHPLALAAAVALLMSGSSAAFAASSGPGFSDVICPEATQYVMAVGKMRNDDPPQKIYDVSQAAVDAYARCSKDKLSNGFREAQHYADTRSAGFAVVAARALVALKRTDEARAELQAHRALVQNVADWQSETMTPSQGHSPGTRGEPDAVHDTNALGGDHRPSMYRTAAKEIVVAIDALLASINGVPPATGSATH
ncbi:MAG: hypothetical protein QOJ39_3619 [Candidatus Eremiobacteraeota bacterium]|jgi:hypothetical protein|nr:hypothetical protein [Candidatus Eremiobacteraeota bacterium]MEA2721755.1 hypothetical protein [Candidatus Eremiobacteraeota bacterium]